MMKMRAGIAACLTVGVLVAGAATVATSATAQAAPQGHAGDPLAACRKWAKTHTFVFITKATDSRKAGLTVSGNTVVVHCGGPDDMQYIPTSKRFSGHLLPSATINVLVFRNGIEFPRLPQSRFPHWVATDHNSGIYAVTGPFKAIRALHEEFHP
ncbi:MAG TPA: hypothetical protein VKU39_16175 [Streptosporangiaceae bacterium]|nr:hypothetical protein [Streptosporangiaceae bacterium]